MFTFIDFIFHSSLEFAKESAWEDRSLVDQQDVGMPARQLLIARALALSLQDTGKTPDYRWSCLSLMPNHVILSGPKGAVLKQACHLTALKEPRLGFHST